jgi:hypothetical protein
MAPSARSVGVTRFVAISVVLVAMCAGLLALPVVAHATTYYVSMVGTDTANGLLGHPVATVRNALSKATESGDVVCVGLGTFSGDMTMTVTGVSLRGAGAGLTTLRGDGLNSVIYVNHVGTGETISGFTITGGNATGGGINCDFSSPTITGNTITGNYSGWGGGICCGGGSPTITRNTIANNHDSGIELAASSAKVVGNVITGNTWSGLHCQNDTSSSITGNLITGNSGFAGGICCSSSSLTIIGNTIAGNIASFGGGGICCINGPSCSPTITGNMITGNTSPSYGGGIYCAGSYSKPAITNNVIAANRASGNGGGIAFAATGSVVSNNTIVDNVDGSGVGGGIYCASPGQPVTNCIVWGNSSTVSGCSLTYSDRPGLIQVGSHNTSADPLFAAPESGDYHLTDGSPCRDVATSTAAPATDRDGITRPWGASFDMGAYEYYVPTYHTSTSLTAPKSVKVKKSLTLSGGVLPPPASPYAAPGKVTITMTRKVGKKWKGAGSAKISLVNGAFTYSFKPKYKGSWRFTASYSGGVIGPTAYLSSASGVKGVTVK